MKRKAIPRLLQQRLPFAYEKATWFVKGNFEAIKCKSLPEETKLPYQTPRTDKHKPISFSLPVP